MAGPGDRAVGKAGDESGIGLGCTLVGAMTGVGMQKWERDALMAERERADGRALIANGLSSRAMQVGEDMARCIEVCVVVPTQEASEVHCCEEDVWTRCQSNPEECTDNVMVRELDA